ncbi:MAG: methyltransferase domain-containing protein [Syntrophorhabdaceae bacterium]|nr:methyltransferase domain-containing protein [Syntrophorhabdaceae bacterium]
MNTGLYVQYGCGWCTPEEWLNFDASPTLRLEKIPGIGRFIKRNPKPFPPNVRYGDILLGLPVNPNSCKGVYCSHVLEHFSHEDLKIALRNTHALLAEEGRFRFVLPDLRYYAVRYMDDYSAVSACEFMKGTGLGQWRRGKKLGEFLAEWLGNTRHRWMWDFASMQAELADAGFRNIRKAFFNDSEDPMFLRVEEKERWENCLGFECGI